MLNRQQNQTIVPLFSHLQPCRTDFFSSLFFILSSICCVNKTSVVILSHSIVRRVHEFLKHGDIRYSANRGLGKTHSVLYRGVSGRKVHDIISKDMQRLFALGPDVVVLMIGKNDIVPDTGPALLAKLKRWYR